MDSITLSRLAPSWEAELVGAAWAGIAPRPDGWALVFHRAPAGGSPGQRIALRVRLTPPVWAWLEPGGRDAEPDARIVRLESPAPLRALVAIPGDRRLELDLGEHRVYLELWPPGNLVIASHVGRVLWCAHPAAESSFRPALGRGEPYAPPRAPRARNPLLDSDADVAAFFRDVPADPGERLARMSRDFAGLPKGLLEALAPTLPRAVLEPGGSPAGEFRRWVEEAYAPSGPVRAYTWTWPSPGVALLTRALTIPSGEGGPKFIGSYPGWAEAAREVARALPAPVDALRVAAAKTRLRRLERARVAVEADIVSARRAPELRADATALAAFLPRVERGAASTTVPDPSDPARTRTVALDPKLKPHENVDRLFKRAGKLERVAAQAPARLAEIERDLAAAREDLAAAERGEAAPARPVRRARAAGPGSSTSPEIADGQKKRDRTPSALVPRKYRTTEGWEVWIGKNNQGNDHLTHRLARSEDYWLHVHGAAGSHVVLRRGKGPNEPSKATIEEVAGWAAFFSQARNAGTVPVTVTQKKYVSKPRKSPAGLAHVLRSKTVFARPVEPPDGQRVGEGD